MSGQIKLNSLTLWPAVKWYFGLICGWRQASANTTVAVYFLALNQIVRHALCFGCLLLRFIIPLVGPSLSFTWRHFSFRFPLGFPLRKAEDALKISAWFRCGHVCGIEKNAQGGCNGRSSCFLRIGKRFNCQMDGKEIRVEKEYLPLNVVYN